jgi:transposase
LLDPTAQAVYPHDLGQVSKLQRRSPRLSYNGLQMTATFCKVYCLGPYPKEFRVRVVTAVENGGLSIPATARSFQVGLTFIKKMLRLPRAGEPLEPRQGGGPVPVLQEKEMTLVRQGIRPCPEATLEEWQRALAEKCHATASLSPIARRLQGLNLPREKKSHRE